MSTSMASSVVDLGDPDLSLVLDFEVDDWTERGSGELIRGGEEEAATVDEEGVINRIRPGRAGILNAT